MDQARPRRSGCAAEKLPKPVTVVAAAPKADRTEQDVLQDIADLEDRIESMPEFLAAPSRNTMLPALKEELEGYGAKAEPIKRLREFARSRRKRTATRD